MELTDFLLARIAEDHAAADLVQRPYGDHAATNDAAWWASEREWFQMGLSSDETALLTRMTPQRVLADCEAKRRIVEDCLDALEQSRPSGTPTEWGRHTWGGLERALRILAQPHREHPDFRDEWRA